MEMHFNGVMEMDKTRSKKAEAHRDDDNDSDPVMHQRKHKMVSGVLTYRRNGTK